nr:hypothetical protein [Tanacetum cinerariifolium]
MAEQQTINYASQWNNMTMDNVIFQTNNMVEGLGVSTSFGCKAKKWKSQTVTSTLPQSQGLEALGELSKKSKRPKSKKPPTETKVTPPKLMEGFEQSHSVSSGTGTATHPQDSRGNKQPLDRYITFTIPDEGTAKTTPRPKGSLRYKDSGGNKPPTNMEPLHPSDVDLSGIDVGAILLSEYEAQESEEDILGAGDEMDDTPLDQTNQLVEASMSSFEKSNTTITDLYKGLEVITQLLKDIKNSVKDDLATNKKIEEASKTLAKISIQTTKILSSQEEALAAWMKSSTNMAWNLGSRISGLEGAQNHIKSSMSSLQEDTSSIKSLMTEMCNAFGGQSSSAPLSSVTLTFAISDTPANFKRENVTILPLKNLLLILRGRLMLTSKKILKNQSNQQMQILGGLSTYPPITKAQPITIIHPEPSFLQREVKGIVTDNLEEDQRKLVKASSIVCPDPNKPVRVEFVINGKAYYLTEKEIQEYWDKEEKIKKAKEEARLNAISKTEVIKVIREEAKKIGIHLKEVISSKYGKLFKKAQDDKHEVLKRQHTKKASGYNIYRGTDGRNFSVHKPFLFGAFRISELDELREIIPKKKNTMVKHLMNSLSRRYKRLRQILGELGIQSALPAPEQAPSQTSRRKQKHMELEPKTRIPGLECNPTLLENVLFVNNMVIEEPEHGIFFIDEFGDQAFQRWGDIDKVRTEALVSYLIAASMVKSPEYARFSMKL